MEVLRSIEKLEDDVLKCKCDKAIAAIQRTVDLYGAAGTAFSFNGGKDSTVLLQLIRAAVEQSSNHASADPARSSVQAAALAASPPQQSIRSSNGNAADSVAADHSEQPPQRGSDAVQSCDSSSASAAAAAAAQSSGGNALKETANRPASSSGGQGLGGIRTFVFQRSDDFEEIQQFTADMNEQYDLHIQTLTGDFKQGLTSLVSDGVGAIFLGTRRGDPNADGQEFFCPSTIGWPPFMRVNPILDWTYTDVWAFLQATASPYCCLYDRGFTSIGGISNTAPNSALEKEDGTFAPAHVLTDGRLERAGRHAKPPLERRSTFSTLARSAGLIIIGDEILAAKVDDVNTSFLCAELRAIGWRVKKVAVISDDVAAIAAEVHALSKEMDLVITSGGVGVTPDDMTMAGVAAGIGVKLSRDPEMEHQLRDYFGSNLTTAHLKLAEVPEGNCELIEHKFENGKVSPFSLPRCGNIYVLPGIPQLLKQKWRTLKDHLLKTGGTTNPFRSISLRLSLNDETVVAPALQQLQEDMPDQLAVGSYPLTAQADGAGIVLSLESKDVQLLQAARDSLLTHLPARVVISEEHDTLHYSSLASQ